jgi:predicted nucleotidyltransferase
MDKGIQSELDSIKTTILKTVPVNKIYLFGSYAYGEPNRDSDFDIYVVIPDDGIRPLEAMQKIGFALYSGKSRPVDIIVGKESRFEQRKLLPTIERTIAREGVVLYGNKQPLQTMA